MKDLHLEMIETFFFALVDRGVPAEETPLFSGILGGRPLVEVIAHEYAISIEDATAAIDAARQEVAL